MQKNVYDLRKEQGLYAIISEKEQPANCVEQVKTAIFIYLYYSDSMERYFHYINGIPRWIDVYIISSNVSLLAKMKENYKDRKFIFLEKPNRGRDVSAFCVASREYIYQYEYICFIHDKREKYDSKKNETESWISNLWGNTLKNAAYIENVIAYMNENERIGLLCPMEPIQAYDDTIFWGCNYNNVVLLAKRLEINEKLIREDRAPISLGTVFWARTDALKKIIVYNWSYDDFVEEPMPDDGTISHAIERILPYVAQDAGYEVSTVMSKTYASKTIAEMYDNWLRCGAYLRNKIGVRKADELDTIERKISEVKRFSSQYNKVYIYGAGKFAVDLQNLCKTFEIKIDGCIVTDINSGNNYIKDIPIYEFGTIDIRKCGVILAVNVSVQQEIINKLNGIGISDILIYRN